MDASFVGIVFCYCRLLSLYWLSAHNKIHAVHMYLTVLQSGVVLSVVLGLMMSEHENIAREAHVLTLKVIHTILVCKSA